MVQSGPRREPQAFDPKRALVVACISALATLFFMLGALGDPVWWRWVGVALSAYVTGWWIINVVLAYRGAERRRNSSARSGTDHTGGQDDGPAK